MTKQLKLRKGYVYQIIDTAPRPDGLCDSTPIMPTIVVYDGMCPINKKIRRLTVNKKGWYRIGIAKYERIYQLGKL